MYSPYGGYATPRRVKILKVSRCLFADMFKQQKYRQLVVMQGLPVDAKLVGISEEVYFNEDAIGLKFESRDWPEVKDGEPLQEVDIQVRTVNLTQIIGDALCGEMYEPIA